MYREHSNQMHVHLLVRVLTLKHLPWCQEIYTYTRVYLEKLGKKTKQNKTKQKNSLLSQPWGELLTTFSSAPGPTQTRINPLCHRKKPKFQGKSEGQPSRWASLGKRRLSVKGRERADCREDSESCSFAPFTHFCSPLTLKT